MGGQAAGVDMGKLHHGGPGEAAERALVKEAVGALRGAFRDRRSAAGIRRPISSMRTLDLVAEAGLDYVADRINDDMPYPVTTSAGPLTAMPLAWDLSDQRRRCSSSTWIPANSSSRCCAFGDALCRSGTHRRRPRADPHHHAVLMGQPHRIRALGLLLDRILDHAGVWPATGAEIVDAWRAGA
ncbi:MAG: hypothetical protein U1E60_09065 [Reyranellaceae bacterium]